MKRIANWFKRNVAFISWGRFWKGIYVHCISKRYCHRFFLFGHDKHEKPKRITSDSTGQSDKPSVS